MKYSFLFLLLISLTTKAQTISSTEKIAGFIKVWGFLKYYHPEVAKGKQDWDTAFMNRVQQLKSLNTKAAINQFYIDWINSLGKVKKCRSCKPPGDGSLKQNSDNGWLTDSVSFTNELVQQLSWIESNRNTGKNFYVQQNSGVTNTSYNNEKVYKDSIFPSPQMRLLSLARYWNIIQYFFPYKYVIGKDWKTVINEMIPDFENAKDTVAYHLAIRKLTAAINDSHAGFTSPYTKKYFGILWEPFLVDIIDNKAVVIELMNDTLCRQNDIRVGDVFLSVDGKSIEEMIKERVPYTGASNYPTLLRNISYFLLHSNNDSSLMSFERNGIVQNKIVRRYPLARMNYAFSNGSRRDTFTIMDGNIGLVNLGWLKKERVDEVMQKLSNTRAIIFDVRNYPNSTVYKIAGYLNKEKKVFVKFTAPYMQNPGLYYYAKTLTCGKKNVNHYKGKVILLFNEVTQSHAEFTLMALKTAPNVIGIGSQTAGADGNVSYIFLPGGLTTFMTGIGVYYPDGTKTQRIGIIPDIEIKPTIAGIKAGKDEVLERAIIEASK